MAAMITLAANAALAANAQVIGVLRLVGARDTYIARAFVRRFTLRALTGAAAGAAGGDGRRGAAARGRCGGRLSDRARLSGRGWLCR
jgi:cell division transport system permease protein